MDRGSGREEVKEINIESHIAPAQGRAGFKVWGRAWASEGPGGSQGRSAEPTGCNTEDHRKSQARVGTRLTPLQAGQPHICRWAAAGPRRGLQFGSEEGTLTEFSLWGLGLSLRRPSADRARPTHTVANLLPSEPTDLNLNPFQKGPSQEQLCGCLTKYLGAMA